MRVKVYYGLDGMHARVLKELAEVGAEPLSVLFEKSWLSGGPVPQRSLQTGGESTLYKGR